LKIISIGEILWDVYENKEYIGGAPFNFSVHTNRLGHEVYFISAVGEDARGDCALQYIFDYGLSTKYINRVKYYPTGYVDVSKDKDGQPTYVIHHPAAYDYPSLTTDQIKDITSFEPDWLYFGTVQIKSIVARELTCSLLELLPKTSRFYDMNLREGHYTKDLVKKLLLASSVLKLNSEETRICCELFDKKPMDLRDFCIWIVEEFELEGVCVTMGSEGCAIYFDGEYLESPGCSVEVVDSVGAGDAFAAGLLHGLSMNWKLEKVCDFANRLGAIVIERKGALPYWTMDDIYYLGSKY